MIGNPNDVRQNESISDVITVELYDLERIKVPVQGLNNCDQMILKVPLDQNYTVGETVPTCRYWSAVNNYFISFFVKRNLH